MTARSSSHSGETVRLTTGRSSRSPRSLARSSRLPLASLMAPRAVLSSPASSALSRMSSARRWRSRTCSIRSSAWATSSAAWAMTSLAGRWFPLWRRTAASETSYNDAAERFDAPPTRARSMASLSGCSHTVQLRGTDGSPAPDAESGAVIAMAVAFHPALSGVVPSEAVIHLPIGAPHLLCGALGDRLLCPLALVLNSLGIPAGYQEIQLLLYMLTVSYVHLTRPLPPRWSRRTRGPTRRLGARTG